MADELTWRNDEWTLEQGIISQDIEIVVTVDSFCGAETVELYLAEVIFAERGKPERRERAKGWLTRALTDWVSDNQGLLYQAWIDRERAPRAA